jgi:hypothetical protein
MVVSALAVAACSTTQPDRISSRTASFSVVAFAKVQNLDCYEVWQDTSNPTDGIPDIFLDQSICYELPDAPNQKFVPWHYSLAITIVRAGSTTEEIVTSNAGVHGTTLDNRDATDDFISMTGYDPDAVPAANRDPEGDIYFVNGKRVSRGSPIYLGASSLTCPGCPVDLGIPTVLGGSTSFDFDINSGDTIIVRARKQKMSDSAGFLPLDPSPSLEIIGTLSIGGVQVAVNGTTESPFDDGAGFAFSFTVQ